MGDTSGGERKNLMGTIPRPHHYMQSSFYDVELRTTYTFEIRCWRVRVVTEKLSVCREKTDKTHTALKPSSYMAMGFPCQRKNQKV